MLDDPEYWNKLLLHYGLYKGGHLTDAGSVMDQSFKALILFGIMDDTVADCHRTKADEEAARAARRRIAQAAV